MFLGKRSGLGGDFNIFVSINGLVSWYPIGDYNGLISGSFVSGVTGLDQGPAGGPIVGSGVTFDADNTRGGDNRGAGLFAPASFMGRTDSGGSFNPVGSFTIVAFVKITTEWDGVILSYSSGGTFYWDLKYDPALLSFKWTIAGSPGVQVINDNDGALVTGGVWYFVECYYDSLTGNAGIRVCEQRTANYRIPTTINPVEGAMGTRTRLNANFRVGARPGYGSFIGLVCSVGFWTRRLNPLEIGMMNFGLDYPFVIFSPAAAGEGGNVLPYPQAGPAPSDCYATGNPRIVRFTDNTDGGYGHEVWRNDGAEWFLAATLDSGIIEWQDDTAITETSTLAAEGGEEFVTEGSGDTFGTEAQSRYRVRAIGHGEPSAFSNEFDPATVNFAGTEGDAPLTTEGGTPLTLE